MSWTPDLIKELKKLWKKGLTTGEIGRSIGVSKNAVVGKAHRLGLEGRPSPIKHEKVKSAKRAVVAPVKKVVAPVKKSAVAPVKKTVETPIVAPKKTSAKPEPLPAIKPAKKKPGFVGVKLVDLKPTGCRWPEGDPKDSDFGFCGKESVPGKSYCDEHCAVAYSGVFKVR